MENDRFTVQISKLSYIFSFTVIILFELQRLVCSDYASAIIILSTVAIGTIIFYNKGVEYFYLSFAANLLFVAVLTYWLISMNGKPFSTGGDDEFFYLASKELSEEIQNGKYPGLEFFAIYSGAGYILLNVIILKLLSFAGEITPITMRVLNAGAGATIAPVVFLIAKKIRGNDHKRLAAETALLVALFPILIYYAAMGLRDIWIAVFAILLVYILVCRPAGKISFLRILIAPSVLIVLTGMFRPLSTVALVVFWATYLLVSSTTEKANVRKYAVMAILVMISLWTGSKVVEKFVSMGKMYTELAIGEAAEGSIGVKLLMLPSPVNEIARFFYTTYAPVPPMKKLEPYDILIGSGAIIWYYILPFVVAGLFIGMKDRYEKSIALPVSFFMLITIVGIMMTSIDVRHKIVIFPMALFFYKIASSQLSRRAKTRIVFCNVSAMLMLGVFYFATQL